MRTVSFETTSSWLWKAAAASLLLLLPATLLAAPGWLGIGVADITSEKVGKLKLKEERGVEITNVAPNSPAAQAGLKEHDVVLEYNGARVESVEQFQRMVRETPAGRSARLLISRDGANQTLNAKLGERAEHKLLYEPGHGQDVFREFSIRIPQPKIEIPNIPKFEFDLGELTAYKTSRLGMDAESLTKQLGEYFGVPNGEGVLVRSVSPNGPAEKAGIKAGDVITKMDGERVATVRDLQRLAREKYGKASVPVTLIRNKRETTVTVNLERREPEGRLHEKIQSTIQGTIESTINEKIEGRINDRIEGKIQGRIEGKINDRIEERIQTINRKIQQKI